MHTCMHVKVCIHSNWMYSFNREYSGMHLCVMRPNSMCLCLWVSVFKLMDTHSYIKKSKYLHLKKANICTSIHLKKKHFWAQMWVHMLWMYLNMHVTSYHIVGIWHEIVLYTLHKIARKIRDYQYLPGEHGKPWMLYNFLSALTSQPSCGQLVHQLYDELARNRLYICRKFYWLPHDFVVQAWRWSVHERRVSVL